MDFFLGLSIFCLSDAAWANDAGIVALLFVFELVFESCLGELYAELFAERTGLLALPFESFVLSNDDLKQNFHKK